ncbi:iron ABC transporter permease [Metarhizobium album]|uniref:Iron ABC transporter permease n=1 Tax=Metarhizobium album TaxID=2182425 RepID=A0A2U2DGT5_9HYPH|nr:iron ABC transporter permease [Rhizobium album]
MAGHILQAPVCVPGNPQRVVVLDPFYNLGMALEIGVPVVGAPLLTAPDAGLRVRAQAASIVDIGDTRQPDLERIVALKPDLILGDGQLHGQFYDKLARIAPTALIDVADWKDYFLTLGDVTGRSDKTEEALRIFRERASAIKSRMPADIEVSVIRVAIHGFHVYLDGPAAYAPYAVLHEAGVKRTAYETTDDDTVLKRPTWEEIAELNGRILLYVVAAGNSPGQDEELEAETIANPLWKMLPAVQAGRAYRVDKAAWFGFNSVASAHRILDDVERYILTAP